jgi:SAM-dependent methyltransferase
VDKILASQKELYEVATAPEVVDHSYEATWVHRAWVEEEAKGSILEIGCGHGSFLKSLDSGWTKVGIDLYGESDGEIRIIKHDVGQPLPFPDNSFNVVNAGFIIEHLLDTDIFISESFRVLKPGGAFIVSTMNMGSPRVWGRLLFGIQPDVMSFSLYDGCRHTRYYTFSALKRQLESHGYTFEKRHGAIFMRRLFKLLLPQKMRIGLFGLIPQLGGEMIVKARKPIV